MKRTMETTLHAYSLMCETVAGPTTAAAVEPRSTESRPPSHAHTNQAAMDKAATMPHRTHVTRTPVQMLDSFKAPNPRVVDSEGRPSLNRRLGRVKHRTSGVRT